MLGYETHTYHDTQCYPNHYRRRSSSHYLEDLDLMFCEASLGCSSWDNMVQHAPVRCGDDLDWWDGHFAYFQDVDRCIDYEVNPVWSRTDGWVLPGELPVGAPLIKADWEIVQDAEDAADSDYKSSNPYDLFSASDSEPLSDMVTESDLTVEDEEDIDEDSD